MNAIDGTEHYERSSEAPSPSLLVIVLDTNPQAWSELASSLPLSKAVANLLVFINAHLAFNNANKVAVIASHCQRTKWLYPTASTGTPSNQNEKTNGAGTAPSETKRNILDAANKYRPFAMIEEEVLRNLRELFETTTPAEINSTNTTLIAGALTLALSYINKTTLSMSSSGSHNQSSTTTTTPSYESSNAGTQPGLGTALNSRILIVSTSGDLASQYIPIMNLIFASQHSRIPIDILKLAGDTVLLQQASYTTQGIFLTAADTSDGISEPSINLEFSSSNATSKGQGKVSDKKKEDHKPSSIASGKTIPNTLLPHLLFGLLPDAAARAHLIPPTAVNVDFRAACFCHRRVVDIGYVCSICLSIFCEALADGVCLTCGTKLNIRGEGVAPKKKKKRKRVETATGSPAGTQ